jgi:hypothetical protein
MCLMQSCAEWNESQDVTGHTLIRSNLKHSVIPIFFGNFFEKIDGGSGLDAP